MAREQRGRSGRRLATAIVAIAVAAGIAGLLFREFTPRAAPTTSPSSSPSPSPSPVQ